MNPVVHRQNMSSSRNWVVEVLMLTIIIIPFLTSCSSRLPDTGNTVSRGTAQANALSATQASTTTLMTTQASQSPPCKSPAELTPALTEGPFFKAGSPQRASLIEPGIKGTKLVLSGYILTADCKPVAGALLDFWQANAQGQYDNTGYMLRGHQFSDVNGHYQLETIVPGLYPGRTEHIHVKVQAPDGPVLTTQLFFPGVVNNDSDGIYSPKLLMTVQDTQDGKLATFNFILGAP